LAWIVEFTDDAKKDLSRLDKPIQKKIIAFMKDRLQATDNPRSTGKALQGNLSGYWRYRVGDYRVICQIHDAKLIILVIDLGHRKDVY
jgi:mRNA interferase RelE/StbE